MLLLLDRESYGWALIGALHERGIRVDTSYAYRKLRELEHAGAVASRWVESDVGPRRRSYHRMPEGPQMLAELAAAITARRDQYDAFLRAHQAAKAGLEPVTSDGPGGREHDPAAPAWAHDAAAPSPTKELIAAWMLVLLERGASYGYGLGRALGEHHINADPGGMYRVLRKLDDARCVRSRWVRARGGPQRRAYLLTDKGRRHRDELASAITDIRDSHTLFLNAYEHSHR